MSLAVSVDILSQMDDEEGIEYYRSEFDELSAELAENGVTWTEPDAPAADKGRARLLSFGYSTLHYLRRVYALHKRGAEVTPVLPDEELDTELERDESYNLFSHLICHSDCDGYYVPVDFGDPLYLDAGSVGSSQRLLRELRECAPHIGVELTEAGELTDEEAERDNNMAEGHPYQYELEAWILLFEAARVSVASGHAVVFG
jgi:hypothetical protein